MNRMLDFLLVCLTLTHINVTGVSHAQGPDRIPSRAIKTEINDDQIPLYWGRKADLSVPSNPKTVNIEQLGKEKNREMLRLFLKIVRDKDWQSRIELTSGQRESIDSEISRFMLEMKAARKVAGLKLGKLKKNDGANSKKTDQVNVSEKTKAEENIRNSISNVKNILVEFQFREIERRAVKGVLGRHFSVRTDILTTPFLLSFGGETDLDLQTKVREKSKAAILQHRQEVEAAIADAQSEIVNTFPESFRQELKQILLAPTKEADSSIGYFRGN